uniref:Ribosomal protein n=1 Tax=Helicotheca tamesis TaxID=374047 RepID=A0A7S2HL48_9STRA|eukprot:CAMPEP_0185738706 /NCGR_PEP_ID=MMETSP1171-20130828/33685_1 /TAXON_ID=374046 /ORGANISM="Helicotheca tamensis, Strain CCMP826" /LENGTH=315 /DNA_ID=CAMNT_0028410041 /DNA_START=13 /DNA_END=960 /DNA_ORIENTATION=+
MASHASLLTATLTRNRHALRPIIQYQLYTSRAHPQPKPTFAVQEALGFVLEGTAERRTKRELRWERNREKREKKGLKDDGPYRNQDETIEIAVNLNLDPRKPNQSLRGSFPLPHGTGKTPNVIAFVSSDKAAEEALKAGAVRAGGQDLVDEIASGTLAVSSFDRTVASKAVLPKISKIARVLGPRGLMPNPKLGTVSDEDDGIVELIEDQLAGSVPYRTDKDGIIHAGIGKASFDAGKILDNVRAFMNGLQEVKPENFGKGKKKGGGGKKGGGKGGSNAKYYLSAHLTSTMGKGYKLDLRSVDPTSAYFMGELPE